MSPTFSIILPVYNVERYIERSILSCLSQDYTDYEIIIVDDCGSDHSIDIAIEMSKEDKRIKIVRHNKNLGTFHARKTGVLNAVGKYIVFLDPDDELSEKTLSSIYKKINFDPDIFLFGVTHIPTKKSSCDTVVLSGNESREKFIEIIIDKKVGMGTAGKAFKRNFLCDLYNLINFSKEQRLIYGEDKLLMANALLYAGKVYSVEYKGYMYHKNDTSITNVTNSKEQELYKINQLNTMIDYLKTMKNENYIDDKILKYFYKDLQGDVIRLKIFQSDNFILNIRYYLNVFLIRKTFNSFVKIFIYILSFGFLKV